VAGRWLGMDKVEEKIDLYPETLIKFGEREEKIISGWLF
jgi:hypothetical protein